MGITPSGDSSPDPENNFDRQVTILKDQRFGVKVSAHPSESPRKKSSGPTSKMLSGSSQKQMSQKEVILESAKEILSYPRRRESNLSTGSLAFISVDDFN